MTAIIPYCAALVYYLMVVLDADNKPIESLKRRETPEQMRLRELENQLATLEDTVNCSICMERKKTIAFLCGHSACSTCAHTLKNCHMCRKSISKKINLFES